MSAPPRVMSGARAVVSIQEQGSNGTSTPVGIFTNISYSVQYDAQGVWVLGGYSAREIDYTAVELVSINATGWRVINHGAHREAGVPTLKQILTKDYLTFVIKDRATGVTIATIENVRATGHQGGFTNKQLSEITLSFVGTFMNDETSKNDNSLAEDGSAVLLPDPST